MQGSPSGTLFWARYACMDDTVRALGFPTKEAPHVEPRQGCLIFVWSTDSSGIVEVSDRLPRRGSRILIQGSQPAKYERSCLGQSELHLQKQRTPFKCRLFGGVVKQR